MTQKRFLEIQFLRAMNIKFFSLCQLQMHREMAAKAIIAQN